MGVKIKQKNPNAIKELARRYASPDYAAAVGYPSSKTGSIEYPDGTPVILVAATNEFGSKSRKIPARPFMKLSKEPAMHEVAPIIKKFIPLFNKGDGTKKNIVKVIGTKAVPIFQDTIVRLRTPENAPSTIKRKKSSNPLIDTALMKNSLTFEVRKISALEGAK